jgi:hypothetical protein
MNPRIVSASLLVLAAALYVGVALPGTRRLEAAQAEYRRVRDERHEALRELAPLDRREAARRRATPIAQLTGDPVGALRQAVLKSLGGTPLTSVRLQVHPARAPLGAEVQLSAEGTVAEVMRFAGELGGPRSGVVLERLHLASAPAGVSLELQAFSLGGPLP